MKKTIRKAPPLLTVGELKRMLDDVYDGCIVHLSGTGGVRRIEVVRGRVYRGMRFLRNIKTIEMLRVFTSFSGYDSQCLALRRLGIPFELVGWSEIDKYAIQAHDVLFPEAKDRNYGDISKIDWAQVPDFDLFTYSFPCTDISNAGQQKGLEKGSGTRSSLLWECEKAIRVKKPKYLLMENVSALVSQKFLPYYEEWRRLIVSLGYESWSKVLNATDYGVPQNRERIFMVSILGGGIFYFPEPMPLNRCLGDVLEDEVDEKYFLSNRMLTFLTSHNEERIKKGYGPNFSVNNITSVAKTITTKPDCKPESNYIKQPICLNSKVNGKQPSLTDRVYSAAAAATAVTTGFHPLVCIGSAQKNAYKGSVKEPSPTITAACGMGGGQTPMVILQRGRGFNKGGVKEICPTISTSSWQHNNMVLMSAENLRQMAEKSRGEEIGITIDSDGNLRPHRIDKAKSGVSEYQTEKDTSVALTLISARPNNVYGESTDYRIRKLTPRECLRLMDADDSDIDKLMAAGISNTQLYKMAGNSIVVNVLYHIFRKMFVNKENENIQLTLF